MSHDQHQQYNRDFIYSIPSKVLFHPDLTFLQKQIYAIVRSFMDTTGDAYPSNNWIARLCGVERNAVIVGLKALIKHNLIQKVIIDGRRHLVVNQSPIPLQPLLEDSPSIPTNTPPSIPTNTQLDQSNIRSKKDINNIADSKKSAKKKPLKDYQKDERFMRFYGIYPNKQKPLDAWKAFKSIVGDDDELLNHIVKDVEERKKRHTKWQDKQFIIYPAAYLRSGTFDGEIVNEKEQAQAQAEQERIKKEARAKADKEAENQRALESQRRADLERQSKPNQEKPQQRTGSPRSFNEIMKGASSHGLASS